MFVEVPERAESMATNESSDTGTSKPWARWTAFALAGGLALWLSTWVGSVTFYWGFQRVLLAQGEDPGSRAMLWSTANEVSSCEHSSWPLHADGDVRFRLPPGEPLRVEALGSSRRVEVGEREFLVQSFPPGFIGTLFRKEMQLFGHALEARTLPGDVDLLAEIVERTPDDFEFGWGRDERDRYASHVLVKMLLFEPLEVSSTRLVRRASPAACACITRYRSGDCRVLTVDSQGSLVIAFGADAPAEWRENPGLWLR